MGNPFEKPKTPEEIAQLMKERESSDDNLRTEGAKQEMNKDLQNKEMTSKEDN